MSSKKFVIVIPARLNSKRLPAKVMKLIGKETMILRVIKNSLNIKDIEKIFLCTDNQVIANEAMGKSVEIILKSGNFSSGTDRIVNSSNEILEFLKLNNQFNLKDLYVINIQADQPFIDRELIEEFILKINSMDSPEVLTSYYESEYKSSHDSSDRVKLVTSKLSGRVLYFSRSNIPYNISIIPGNILAPIPFFLKYHIGIYAYRFDILKYWLELKTSQLEEYESLEQLRWLENDIPIYAFKFPRQVLSVDNYKDLEYARSIVLS